MSTTTPYPPGFLHILQPKKWCDKKQVSCEYANIHGRCMCTCCQRRDLEKERAMSLPVCEDAISKHDLWRIIEDNAYWITYNETSREKGMTLTGINQALNECPPVEPKRPKGEWIKATGAAPPEFTGRYVCSNCGNYALMDMPYGSRQVLSHFCPNCMADMRDDKE